MDDMCVWMLCFMLLFFIKGSTAGSYCYTSSYSTTKYCTYGCCDVSYSIYDRCCLWSESSSSSGSSSSGSGSYSSYYDEYYDDTNWVGVIVGSTIGGIVFLAIVITTCVCICIKMSKSPVTVVHPAPPNPGPTVVMTGPGQGPNSGGYGNPQMNQYPAGHNQGIVPPQNSVGYVHPQINQYPAGPSQGPVPPPYTGAPATANPDL